jgi:hypothetical protein
MRSKTIGLALDSIPAWWLVILQVYRSAAGFVWLATWSLGRLPAGFALPVGIGDGLVGVLAVIAVDHWSSRRHCVPDTRTESRRGIIDKTPSQWAGSAPTPTADNRKTPGALSALDESPRTCVPIDFGNPLQLQARP